MKKVISFVLFAVYLAFTAGALSNFVNAGEHFCTDGKDGIHLLADKKGKPSADLHRDMFGFKHLAKHIASASKIKVTPFHRVSPSFVSLASATNDTRQFIKPLPLFDQSSIYLTNRTLLL